MSASPSSSLTVPKSKLHPNWVWLVCLFVLLMALIQPAPVGGDTSMYVADVRTSLSHGWGRESA